MNVDELHDRLYDMLRIVDTICRRNDITYWMHGGSAIGAIRDHDFIPWDDDMDILIPAEEYPKFKMIMKRELPEHFKLVEPQDFSPFFYDFIIRIVDDRWRLRKEIEEDVAYNNYQNSLCIDVFLLSGFPKSMLRQKAWFLKYDILYGMALRYRYRIDYAKLSNLQKCGVFALRCLGFFFSGKTPDAIIKQWEKFIFSFNPKSTKMRMVSNTTPHCYWHPMPNDWFQNTVFVRFKDMEVPLPQEYDKELTFTYGNYMIPIRDSKKYITHLNSEDT